MRPVPRVVRGLNITYPVFLEASYKKQLLQLTKKLESLILELLAKNDSFLSSFNKFTRVDDMVDDLERYIRAINAAISIEAVKAIQALKHHFTSIKEFCDQSFKRSFNHAMPQLNRGNLAPITITPHTGNIELLKKMWIEKNTQLIKDIPTKALVKIRDYIYEAVSSGETIQSLSARISKEIDLTKKRAKLIARDQIAKLKSDLNRHNYLSHGITMYEWRTCGDDAVRGSHKIMQGKICSWLDPGVYKNKITDQWKNRASIGGVQKHVGADILCRCTNIIVIEQT